MAQEIEEDIQALAPKPPKINLQFINPNKARVVASQFVHLESKEIEELLKPWDIINLKGTSLAEMLVVLGMKR